MKHQTSLPMVYVETPNTRLLLAKAEDPIPPDSFLVLRKIADVYQLVIVEQSGDTSDPVTLASFLAPEDVDAGEVFHAACIALESSKPKRKPRKRKKTTASH